MTARHAPHRALTPDESEDRRERCGACGLAIGHVDGQGNVWHQREDGACWCLVQPVRWTPGDYYDQPIDAAAGPVFARESACLGRYRIWTVGEFATLVMQDAPILARLDMTWSETGAKTRKRRRAMYIQRARLQALCVRLREAQGEFTEWRAKQCHH